MKGWSARIAVIAVFVVGLVCGAAGMHLYRLRIERQIATSREPVIQLVIMALDRDLRLTPDQRDRVREVLLDTRRQMLAAHPELVPELVETFERTQDRIAELLTPEQREKYQRLVDERRRTLRQIQEGATPPQ